MKKYPYPTFAQALLELGDTRPARAARLDVDPKTLDRILVRLPRALRPFKNAPHLLRALAEDLEKSQVYTP